MKKRKGRKLLRLLLLLGLLCGLLLADQRILVADRYEIPIRELPASFDGLRIVQLSDLHGAEFGTDNSRLLEKVRREKPDLIALTGDFVASAGDLPVFGKLLPRLQEIAPCYYVSGNHEWACGMMEGVSSALRENGVTYLNNRWVFLERGGERLCLCGVDDPNSFAGMITPGELIRQLREQEGDMPTVLLGHRNDWPEKWPELDVDAILCGHAHGGIIRIPGVTGVLGTGRSLFPPYTAGLHTSGRYTMAVSRGLGNIHCIPRVFNCPEIVVLTLKKAE